MRYPLWTFFFVLIMPIFTTHALLTGKAELLSDQHSGAAASSTSARAYWTHHVASR